jgi:hypothetical protein
MRSVAVGTVVIITAALLVIGHLVVALAARTALMAPPRQLFT